jgi:Phage integrase, N-terminal SAM-like domain
MSPFMGQPAPRLQVVAAHSPQAQPKLLDRVRSAIRTRHYSIRTEEAYIGWIRRFILFHQKRHPAEMSESEINQFLTHLAVRENVAASTQNQALSAILFLYQEVLERDLDRIDGVVRAKKPVRLPACAHARRSTGTSRADVWQPEADCFVVVWGWLAPVGSLAAARQRY